MQDYLVSRRVGLHPSDICLELSTCQASARHPTDLALHCGDITLDAHRVVVAAASPLLRELIMEGYDKHDIFLPDINIAHARMLLQFLYGGQVAGLAPGQGEELQGALQHLQVTGLEVAALVEEAPGLMSEKLPTDEGEGSVYDVLQEGEVTADEREGSAGAAGDHASYTLQADEEQNCTFVWDHGSYAAAVPPSEEDHTFGGRGGRFSLEQLSKKRRDTFKAKMEQISPSSWQCRECGVRLEGEERSYRHSDLNSCSTKPKAKRAMKPQECEDCGAVCQSRELLRKHRLNEHGRHYKCSKCDKTFTLRQNWIRHIVICRGEAPRFQCDLCDKAFSSNFNLKIHKERRHGQEEQEGEQPPVKCDRCQELVAKFDLKDHLKNCVYVCPWSADGCEVTNKRIGKHKAHIRSHNKSLGLL